ncbi:GGDEF domain-containing protein [Paraglaciecola arctica]|uniref:diguanylate cyclase n=1 Tax=Paraglaciecola arctica BSs20135 TaxID=493475 RepID=K6YM01_9ALTE|nr:GGDEF domain-containing protein [Paraglaciecola arctica]GAC17673.1 GGDEF domain protein [Paraglaciecola arctica BSs20135]
METTNNDRIRNVQGKDRRPEFWLVFMRSAQVAALIDVAFFFLFYALGSPILAWVNIVSVAIYTLVYYASKNRKKRIAVALIWSEVIIHAGLGIILIGWESGFHYYLLMFIPAICLSTSFRPALITLTVLFACYVGLDFLAWFIEPIQPINSFALKIVHLFNLSVVFVMLSYLSLYYLKTARRAQKKLNILATTDPLTELYNRRYMNDLVDKEIQDFNRTNDGIGIILIDIDYFKKINDQYGHKVGDDVLVRVAQIIKKQVRKQDLISRWGGEEFLIILPDTPLIDVQLSAERIRAAFLTYDWLKEIGEDVSPTITAGISELKQAESLDSAIARADRALYKGKADGRNRVEL